jgi:Carbohydrate family 9 binding domain-like
MRSTLLSMMLLCSTGCRDEQAGPRPKGPRAPPAAAAAAQVRVLEAAPPGLSHVSGATWAGGAVTYLGSIVEPAHPKAQDNVTLKHYFRATGPVTGGPWRFFMHVMDESSHQQVGNLDHELQNGAAPLGSWPTGKVIEDVHAFAMPNLQGAVRLYLGFWNDSGRLSVDSAPMSDGQGRVLGPKIEGPQVALPEYAAVRAAKPPVIDGKLDDNVWATAKEQPLTRSFDGGPVGRKTTFRIAYDETNLYVAFRAEDPDVWGSLTKKDDPIYTEDVVEVFLDADGDGRTYNELQVSPHNVSFDASFVSRRSDLDAAMKWESGMQTQVFIKGTLDDDSDTDEFWSAEMKIPLANLTAVPHAPKKGDRWRFNAYRLEHLERRKSIEGQSFSPLFIGDFHALPRFGWLSFE